MKIISKKDIILLIIFGPIILFFGLMYFYPIPKSLKPEILNASFKRCLYSNGIMYSKKSYIESFQSSIYSITYYDSKGKMICSSGGIMNEEVKELCKNRICMSTFNYYKTVDSLAKYLYKRIKTK